MGYSKSQCTRNSLREKKLLEQGFTQIAEAEIPTYRKAGKLGTTSICKWPYTVCTVTTSQGRQLTTPINWKGARR